MEGMNSKQDDEQRKFYVSTPIYYLNSAPHIGHTYTTVLADVLARYARLKGDDVFFLTGSDEHGQKMQESAEKLGVSPQELVDKNVKLFLKSWDALDINYSDFIRTTEARHVRLVQNVLNRLYESGDIYTAEYQGHYCVKCESFVTDRDVRERVCQQGNPDCAFDFAMVREKNYFFRLSRYQQRLIEHIRDHVEFIQPDFRRNETLNLLSEPLADLCISRPKLRLRWGIELPFDTDYVTYVWFDALLNYLTPLGYTTADESGMHRWPPDVQVIGKDILKTHTVYWPIILMACQLVLPRTVLAHGWWMSRDSKMSKSEGNAVSPMDLMSQYGSDELRYYLCSAMVTGRDATYSEEDFVTRYNSDLANTLGNLISRVLAPIGSHFQNTVPTPCDVTEEESDLERSWRSVVEQIYAHLDKCRVDLVVHCIIDAVSNINHYIDRNKPWTLARNGNRRRLATVLYAALDSIRIASALLYPVMPKKMRQLRTDILRLAQEEPSVSMQDAGERLLPGSPLGSNVPLFPRIVHRPAAGLGEKTFGGQAASVTSGSKLPHKKPKATSPAPAEINYEDFKKISLQLALVEDVIRLEGTDKLYRLTLKVGDAQRQIISGLAKHYAADELKGKTVVIVANMKPVEMFGVRSDGMLLAASDGKSIRVLTVDGELNDGSPVL
jgi:methionyl-tRNA synthetase